MDIIWATIFKYIHVLQLFIIVSFSDHMLLIISQYFFI